MIPRTDQDQTLVNEIIVRASQDIGMRYRVKKCTRAIYKRGKLVKSKGSDERLKENLIKNLHLYYIQGS
jgi:hypothetical protein